MGDPTRSSLPDTAVTVCPHPSWELRWEATTSTRTIRTRHLSLCLTLVCTRTTTAGTSTTTFACSPSRDQSTWDPTSPQLACPSSMEEYAEGTTCTVSGRGTTSEGGSLARVLQKVDVPVVSDDHCRDSYGQADITDSMICAGLDQGGKDS